MNEDDFDNLFNEIEYMWEHGYLADNLYFKFKNNKDKENIDFTKEER